MGIITMQVQENVNCVKVHVANVQDHKVIVKTVLLANLFIIINVMINVQMGLIRQLIVQFHLVSLAHGHVQNAVIS